MIWACNGNNPMSLNIFGWGWLRKKGVCVSFRADGVTLKNMAFYLVIDPKDIRVATLTSNHMFINWYMPANKKHVLETQIAWRKSFKTFQFGFVALDGFGITGSTAAKKVFKSRCLSAALAPKDSWMKSHPFASFFCGLSFYLYLQRWWKAMKYV